MLYYAFLQILEKREDQLLISKFLLGILPLHVCQSFVFLEVATFLATKHTGLALSSCLWSVKFLGFISPMCIFSLAAFYALL